METESYPIRIIAPKKATPPGIYFLGLLCFIPLIGLVVGIVLIVLGIAFYKNKILTAFGIFGLLFTVGVYGSLFYFAAHQNGKLYQPIAQSQLNELAKGIEFYKYQNGKYPRDLDDVTKDDKYLMANDLMALTAKGVFASRNTGDLRYHYRRIGDKYTLFSVGVDGIPYTTDDIYPNLQIADTTKYGLVHAIQP